MEESEAQLQPGVAFRLQPDGKWKPEKIPPEALKEAKFSGYLTIQGYRCTVFETPDKNQWAQKSTGTPAEPDEPKPSTASQIADAWLRGHGVRYPKTDQMKNLVTTRVSLASRIASRYLAQEDITSLVQKKLDRDGDDKDYDKAIVDFVNKARTKLPPIDTALERACDVLMKTRDKIEHAHPKVQDRYVQMFLQELAQKQRELEDMRKQLMRGLTVELDRYESEANPIPEGHQEAFPIMLAVKSPSQLVEDEFQVWTDIDGIPFQFHAKNGKLYIIQGQKENPQDAPGAAFFDMNKAEEISPEDADHAESEWTFVEDGLFSLHT